MADIRQPEDWVEKTRRLKEKEWTPPPSGKMGFGEFLSRGASAVKRSFQKSVADIMESTTLDPEHPKFGKDDQMTNLALDMLPELKAMGIGAGAMMGLLKPMATAQLAKHARYMKPFNFPAGVSMNKAAAETLLYPQSAFSKLKGFKQHLMGKREAYYAPHDMLPDPFQTEQEPGHIYTAALSSRYDWPEIIRHELTHNRQWNPKNYEEAIRSLYLINLHRKLGGRKVAEGIDLYDWSPSELQADLLMHYGKPQTFERDFALSLKDPMIYRKAEEMANKMEHRGAETIFGESLVQARGKFPKIPPTKEQSDYVMDILEDIDLGEMDEIIKRINKETRTIKKIDEKLGRSQGPIGDLFKKFLK